MTSEALTILSHELGAREQELVVLREREIRAHEELDRLPSAPPRNLNDLPLSVAERIAWWRSTTAVDSQGETT